MNATIDPELLKKPKCQACNTEGKILVFTGGKFVCFDCERKFQSIKNAEDKGIWNKIQNDS